jgi:multicomponent Na+:H+ antiporter subunit D
MGSLAPYPVVVPLLGAALLIFTAKLLPRRAADLLAIGAAAVAFACTITLWQTSWQGTIVYWFGGWTPREGVAVGIAFTIDPFGAGVAVLAAGLVGAALIYATTFFEDHHGSFHALVLLFLAGMEGFALTGDLFDQFVFLELMSVSAYALTGYKVEESRPLAGAISFAVTNSIGAFFLLIGTSLIYGRTGALNLAQAGAALASGGVDALVVAAITLVLCGYLVKGAIAPFHLWLADAHAVAPAPISVIFSGVMVELGLYGAARAYWELFAPVLGDRGGAVLGALLCLGAATAVIGAVLCLAQRNVKRLLALSTVSHSGLVLCAIGTGSHVALAGAAVYVVAHGLVKAGLFMCAGLFLHRLGSVDEIDLHGKGRGLTGLGVVWTAGGLALAGLPLFALSTGDALVEHAAAEGTPWLIVLAGGVATLTGAAVLRGGARVFLGAGVKGGAGAGAPVTGEEERETVSDGGLPWPMILPAVAMMVLPILLAAMPSVGGTALEAAQRFIDHDGYVAATFGTGGPDGQAEHLDLLSSRIVSGSLSTAAAILIATIALRSVAWRAPGIGALRRMQSGDVRDYVTWIVAGAAALGGALTATLRP